MQVSGLIDVIAVSAGNGYTVALRNDGTVWTWGRNTDRQLGDGTTTQRATPAQVDGLNNIIAISAGNGHTVALRNDGTVWAWGHNRHGQLGSSLTSPHGTPNQIYGLTDVVAISVGGMSTSALRSDGTVWTWGSNSYGGLGRLSTENHRNQRTPGQVDGLNDVISISPGAALRSDGTVWTWGVNAHGQLGDGTTTNRVTPAQVNGLTDITVISAGADHTAVLRSDGTVWAWGDNSDGQLGDGTTANRHTPVQVIGPEDIGFLNLGVDTPPQTPTPPADFTPTVNTFTLNNTRGYIRELITITGIITATNTTPGLMESRSEWSVYPRGAVTFRDMSVQRLDEGRYALTKTIIPQQTGSFTITATVHGVTATAEIVITEPPMPPFHVKTYIADILADHPMYRGAALGVDNSNAYFRLLNFYRDPSNVSAARILTTQLQSSTGFTNSVTAWEALTFSPSQAMDAAGGWSQRQYYNMILFNLLGVMDFESRANELYDANAKMLAGAMNEQFSTLNDWWGSDIATTLGGFSDVELALFTQEMGNLFDGLGVALDVISIANNAVMTVEQLANNAAAYAAVATVGEDIKAVLREMQQVTNNSVLRSAISDMYRVTDGALEQVLRNADLTAVTQFAVGESIDVLWGLVFSMSGLSLLLAGQNAGRAISNFAFSTDALIEQYYILQAVVQVEDVMVATVNRLHTRYLNNRTVANAGAFLSAVDMMIGTYVLGSTYAYDFARIHDSALVHRFSDAGGPILNLITGNRQSTAQFRASANSLRSTAEIFRLNNLHLEAYRAHLAIDYPEIYVLLFGIPHPESASTWAHEGIANAILHGLVPYDLMYNYTANITRGEFAALAVALYETVAGRQITGRMQFNDTNDINVQKLGYLQVASGVEEGIFAPERTLSREQAAVFLARLAHVIGQPLPPAAPTFADNADIFPWAFGSVGQVQAAGIMGDVGNNRFAPQDDYTREQSIITMLRLFDLLR